MSPPPEIPMLKKIWGVLVNALLQLLLAYTSSAFGGFASRPHQGSAPGVTPLGDFCPHQSPGFVPLRNKFLATPLLVKRTFSYEFRNGERRIWIFDLWCRLRNNADATARQNRTPADDHTHSQSEQRSTCRRHLAYVFTISYQSEDSNQSLSLTCHRLIVCCLIVSMSCCCCCCCWMLMTMIMMIMLRWWWWSML